MTEAEFNAICPEEKRVIIAREILESLDADKIRAERQVWLTTQDNRQQLMPRGTPLDTQVQDLICRYNEPCHTCAVGAICYAAIKRFNRFKVADIGEVEKLATGNRLHKDRSGLSDDDFYQYLLQFFSAEQLGLIEYTFESGAVALPVTLTYEQRDRAAAFYNDNTVDDEYGEEESVFRAIFENIIRNSGTFVP